MVRVESKDDVPFLYGEITPELAQQIVARHVPLGDVLDADDSDDNVSPHDFMHFRSSLRQANRETGLDQYIVPPDLPFFTKQVKVVLSETGYINPEKLEDYLAHGGYKSLKKVLKEMTPQQVCEEVLQSGIRGRGGAGFPTGLKWKLTLQEDSEEKFVIVNGDEGDPGAYMDRTVMEDDPHRVLEGMMICAYAIGASYGYLYIRGEYPVAIQRIQRAIRAARRRGILGKSVLGTDFSFDAAVRDWCGGVYMWRGDSADPLG